MLDWLRLLRISGLATIVSNSMAAVLLGFFAGESVHFQWLLARLWHNGWGCLWVPFTSFLLYAAGMVWNDLVDVDKDRRDRAARPLAAGRIGLAPAYVTGVLLVIGAVLASLKIDHGYYGLMAAGLVLSLILLYNLVAKEVPILGSVVMGLTRASHACFALLIIGPDHLRTALVGGHAPGLRSFLVYPLVLGLYVFGLTLVSELEDHARRGRRIELLAGGACVGLALLLALSRLADAPWLASQLNGGLPSKAGAILGLGVALGAAGWAGWRFFRPWWQAVRLSRCAAVPPVVLAGLGGLILLDVVFATAAHPLAGLLVLGLFPVFLGLGRLARMD